MNKRFLNQPHIRASRFPSHLNKMWKAVPFRTRRILFFLIQGTYGVLFALMQLRRTMASPATDVLFWVVGLCAVPVILLTLLEAYFRQEETGNKRRRGYAVSYAFLVIVCYFVHLNVYCLIKGT